MSYARRNYRHRNPHDQQQEQQGSDQSFFNEGSQHAVQTKKDQAFFQPKLTVGEPNDKFEQEADSVADTVANQGSNKEIQEKKIDGIQRLATGKQEEKLSTDEERMKRDKEVQTKPDIQQKCSECEKEEKEKGAMQMKTEEPLKEEEDKKNAQVQTKPDIQHKCAECEKKDKEKAAMQMKSEDPLREEENKLDQVQTKPNATGGTASPQLSSRIEQSAGKGKAMPDNTRAQMQSSFGYDFSGVNIHTDEESANMNRSLGAQAFTHGKDIYFNQGKYNPESSQGQHLLAHELTHVVQQDQGELQPIQRELSNSTHCSPVGAVPISNSRRGAAQGTWYSDPFSRPASGMVHVRVTTSNVEEGCHRGNTFGVDIRKCNMIFPDTKMEPAQHTASHGDSIDYDFQIPGAGWFDSNTFYIRVHTNCVCDITVDVT